MELFGYTINLPAEVVAIAVLFVGIGIGAVAGYLRRR